VCSCGCHGAAVPVGANAGGVRGERGGGEGGIWGGRYADGGGGGGGRDAAGASVLARLGGSSHHRGHRLSPQNEQKRILLFSVSYCDALIFGKW
jgi:hypothetical protein